MDNEKLLEWLKRLYGVKERLVFGLIACVLAFRVYQILVVSQVPITPPVPPKPIEISNLGPVTTPPRPLDEPISGYVVLYRKPTMFEERKKTDSVDKDGAPNRMQDFVLDSIQTSGGSPMAFIRKKGGRTIFAKENDTFESDFTVVKIDVVNKTIVVRDSETKKEVTLSIKEKGK